MIPRRPLISPGITFKKLQCFLIALFWLNVIHVGLLTLRSARMRRVLPKQPQGAVLPDVAEAGMVSWAIQRASRLVPGSACLAQAIAGQTMLALRGKSSHVAVGVKRLDDGTFSAHAWLVAGPMVILGGPLDESYALMSNGPTAS